MPKKIKTLELINYEGPVLKLFKADKNEFVIYDQWDSIVDILNLKDLFSFLDGNITLTDSHGKKWDWTKQHRDAKVSLEKLFIYLYSGYTKKDLEAAFDAGREECSRLTWSDEFVDDFKYDDFKSWLKEYNKKSK